MGNSYNYKGITYYLCEFQYGFYKVFYEISYQNGFWISEINDYLDEDIQNPYIFCDNSKSNCIKKLESNFKMLVDTKQVLSMLKDYKVYVEHPDILFSVKEMPVVYHVSDRKKEKSIMMNGIIPNGSMSYDVMSASHLIDSYKKWYIPNWVRRYYAVYGHPDMGNYALADKGSGYRDCNLYAVKVNPKKCWVGSQGLGGFLLDVHEYLDDKKRMKEKIGYAKDYWFYSCSLENYINNNIIARLKDYYYGLDEVLIFHPILEYENIGYWDENNIFVHNDNFIKYIKPQFKNCFQEIFNYYRGNC